jgi:Tetratricopeptide repeat
MKRQRLGKLRLAAPLGLVLAALLWPATAPASGLNLPAEATKGLDLLYAGQPDKALDLFRGVEAAQPDHPLGYLLEAEARWWQIYCETCAIKWNMIDAWPQPRRAVDDSYLDISKKVTRLAEERIAKGDSAEMELYAGLGWMQSARLLALRNERRATAHAGVVARQHFLRCLELDPQMADADTGLGMYNYYVDTLSTIARVLRVFMGIPGGNKQDGIRQLQHAMQQGVLTRVTARFYLAKNLRTFDLDYAAAIDVMTPLVAQFPQNPLFQLILGDTHAKLGHNDLAAASFRAAARSPVSDAACADRIRMVAGQAQALLAPSTGR